MRHKDLWYKDAIIYCLDVETFQDGNGDGVGDFAGLIGRLGKLAGIGVTCIWLLPFYPTPNRDNGYDVTDYYGVDPRLGTLGDFVEFTQQAGQYGIRVIVDLVVNHTSIDHPWFQAARRDPHSPYRDYYVWAKEKPADAESGIIFPGVQKTTWTYDEMADQYYFHRFYAHQADLNITNPTVQDEICKIMGFWLQLGVSGFRIDAVPFLIEHKGVEESAQFEDEHKYLTYFRRFLSWRRGDAIMLAEANIPPEDVSEYFGDDDRMHMIFHFMLNQHLYLSLAREDPEPIKAALRAQPPLPDTAQWGIFLRNHDELDLGRLSDKERQEVFDAFGPDADMHLYDRGLRRRLAPMMGGDPARLRLLISLLFSLPGTPVMWYGDEIGMGEDLSLPERNSVRTPMQWNGEVNAGFSTAPPDALVRPVVNEGPFAYAQVNFDDQNRDPDSLLNFSEKMIRLRKSCPELGFGRWQIIDCDTPGVLVHCCDWEGGTVMVAHNLKKKKATVVVRLSDRHPHHLIDLVGDNICEVKADGSYRFDLDGYGFRWYRVVPQSEPQPTRHALPAEARFPRMAAQGERQFQD
jgi:maltose alpha-D-glucosyltransferase/alpha-amylase